MPTDRHQPQYALVAKTLVDDIASGKYRVGDLMPPEITLAAQFGVSRNTMRTAMRVLVDMGLVTRRAGMGTLVQARSAAANYVQVVESLNDLYPGLADARQEVVETEELKADAMLARLLACRTGEPWIRFVTVRRTSARGPATACSHIYVPPGYRSVARALHRLRKPSFCALESTFRRRMAEVVQQADAVALPADVALLLGLDEGAPALRTVRRFVGEDGRVAMVTDTFTPPGQEHFTVRLRANWPSAASAAA